MKCESTLKVRCRHDGQSLCKNRRGLWSAKRSQGWSRRLAEVSVGEDHGGHQGPDVQGQTHPAGRDLHPHCWPLAGYGVVCIRAVRSRTQQKALQSTFIYSSCLEVEKHLSFPIKCGWNQAETHWRALNPGSHTGFTIALTALTSTFAININTFPLGTLDCVWSAKHILKGNFWHFSTTLTSVGHCNGSLHSSQCLKKPRGSFNKILKDSSNRLGEKKKKKWVQCPVKRCFSLVLQLYFLVQLEMTDLALFVQHKKHMNTLSYICMKI